jgi:multiple sugar transport system substrate-binding protein
MVRNRKPLLKRQISFRTASAESVLMTTEFPMKRSIGRPAALFATVATVAGLALSGCASSSSSGAPAGDVEAEDSGATLSLWVRPGNEAVTDAVVDAYNESHENQVEITHVPADQYMTKFAQAAQSGSLPDLLATDVVFMPQIVDTGAVLDLTDLLADSGAAADLAPAHVQASTKDGRVYGVPYVSDTSLYVYNKDLFREAGLDPEKPPTTWDGITDAAEKITALGDGNQGFYVSAGCTGCLAYDVLPLIWAQGGDVINDDGTFDFDNPETQNALAFLRQQYETGGLPDNAKTDTGDGFFAVFASGKVGIDLAGANGVNTSTLGTDPAFEVGLAPIPGPDDGQFATFSGGDTVSISASSKNVNAAWDFIEWLTSPKTSEEVYFSLPAIPPRSDVTAPDALGDQFAVPAQLVKDGKAPASLWYNDVIGSAQGPWLEMIQSVVFNGVDPAEATQTAQQAADAITSR